VHVDLQVDKPSHSTPPAPTAEERRQHQRVPGPFEGVRTGLLDMPVQIFDLSAGGCFVNAIHEEDEGVRLSLRIYLPAEGWIAVSAVTLYRRPGYGFAVRFVDPDAATRGSIERALATLVHSRQR
jgi:hypothetical protein